MSANNLSFRDFLEDVEKQLSYLGGLEDELGIEPEDIAKGAQVASFFNMGDTYNLSPYKIVGYLYDSQGKPTHARCKIMNDLSNTRKRWKNSDGKYTRIDDAEPDEKIYTIPIGNLEDMLSQGMSQAMGAMGSPGGGLGGLGM